MANLKFNAKNVRRVPINRNTLFYDAEMFALEREIGKDYIEQDMGQSVILYQIDMSKTQTDAIYGETDPDSIIFKTPIEIPCTYKIEQPELKSYDKTKQLGTYIKRFHLHTQNISLLIMMVETIMTTHTLYGGQCHCTEQYNVLQ